jgi:hypothetical protein
MALPGLVAAKNLADVADRERAWDNLGLNISATWEKLQNLDPDASAYIDAVALVEDVYTEPGVQRAINDFIIGCKADGIWSAIKASCILAGARTLNGALIPLTGVAPVNNGFAQSDYNRKTGLKGNGSNKWLTYGSNVIFNSTNRHLFVRVTEPSSLASNSGLAGCNPNAITVFSEMLLSSTAVMRGRPWGGDSVNVTVGAASTSLAIGRISTNSALSYSSVSGTVSSTSSYQPGGDFLSIFARNPLGANATNPRIAFYSGGDYANPVLLDIRVTALINAIADAIP